MKVEKEKLIDYLLAQNEKLNAQVDGLRDEMRLQREESAQRHQELMESMERIQEQADANERRAEEETARRMAAEKRTKELSALVAALIDGSASSTP